MLSLKLGGLVVYYARLAFAASKGPADCAVSLLSRCFRLFLLLEMLNFYKWVCSLSGFCVQDVAVKVFLDQHVQMEAIEEFKAEVCVSVMSHSCKTFHQVF
jgi:hypothetical protein